MKIVYETNGKGFLGWIIDYPGAYVRGRSIEEARGKIKTELIEFSKWINKDVKTTDRFDEEIVRSNLAIDDADSDIILENEILDDNEKYPIDMLFSNMIKSASRVFDIWNKCDDINKKDTHLNKQTFYGKANCTICSQYMHIVNVQNYYLSMINESIPITSSIIEMRLEIEKILNRKYRIEGNRIYRYENELWNVRKIIRRTIWHDRIHARAIIRMKDRIKRT